jgi:sporulation protein YlmC with PRC-barrel domain
MTRHTLLGLTTLTLVLSAGSTLALGQSERPRNPEQNRQPADQTRPNDRSTRDRVDARQNVALLHKASDLIGSSVKNPNGDDLGTVSDMIVQRGSGRIVFAVINAGSVLGMGGKDFAVPLNELTWSATDKCYHASMTPEQVERQTEFLPDDWNDLQSDDWMDNFRNWIGVEEEDTVASEFERGEMTKIEGRVVDVRRDYKLLGNELVHVYVQTKDGQQREAVLGPSWYVMGHDAAPFRGTDIVINAVERDGVWYAASAGKRGNELTLRGEDGRPAWNAEGSPGENRPARYILMSDLIGADAESRGNDSGEVQDIIVERNSGRIAFLAFDANENFLGIGDEIRLIPWSMVAIDRDLNANIDADAATIGRAVQMPEDLEAFGSGQELNTAYTAFGTEPTRFERMSGDHQDRDDRGTNGSGRETGARDMSGDAWGKNSAMVKALSEGEKVQLEGTITAMTASSLSTGSPEASMMTINTTDKGRVDVLLAPRSYMDNQKMPFRVGDTVRIEGRSAMINSRKVTAAWSVKSDKSSLTLWNDKTPVWAR